MRNYFFPDSFTIPFVEERKRWPERLFDYFGVPAIIIGIISSYAFNEPQSDKTIEQERIVSPSPLESTK